MLSIILWIVFGAVVGFIADFIDSGVTLSWPEKIVVGIVGAVVGGSLAQLLTTGTIGLTAAGGFDLISIVVSVVGALIALFVWKHLVRGRSTTSV